ncbi:MAG: YeeE/YedE family protein [Gammaproteobacteria bacterium]|nr:YeeE/YedE family protein [Gammaproteobacteria bacterium]
MHGYLSWWLGGIALGGITILFRALTGRTLGVSGSWRKVAFWRQEHANDKAAQSVTQHQDSAANALLAATLAEFGNDALITPAVANDRTQHAVKPRQPVPWTAHLVFLFCMALGGFVWALMTGNLHLQFELSAIHSRISGGFGNMSFMLLVGGFFVGMGTQMAGGCSSGHGLSGCSNFSWGSLLATAIFFATAVVAANLIKVVLS